MDPVGINSSNNNGSYNSNHASYHPSSDAQTYRDLLIFEERLKQNAARLIKRKKKYQTFLVLLCGSIGLFSYYVFIRPAIEWQALHYLNVTCLLITATMLLLFFASGLYSERIIAANKFVPQANRSLRSYNMYLNTRTAPRRSFLSFFRRPEKGNQSFRRISPTSTDDKESQTDNKQSRSASNLISAAASGGGTNNVGNKGQPTNGQLSIAAARRLHIPTIPPSNNPRGEVIFSSKVPNQFREGYERYRAAFERRRAEKMEERRNSGWRGWWIFGGNGGDENGKGGLVANNKGFKTNTMEGGSGFYQSQSKGSPASSIRGSVRSSPRSSRARPKINMTTNLSPSSNSGSENSSPANSRASSPISPSLSTGSNRQLSTSQRGRKMSTANSKQSLQGTDDYTERRGRDRTPSITAVSDERLRRGSSSSSSGSIKDYGPISGTNAAGQRLDEPIQLDFEKKRKNTDPIIEENLSNNTDAEDAAEADAQLASVPMNLPNPTLVVEEEDNRSAAIATLREPE